MQEILVYLVVLLAGIFIVRHVKNILTRGEKEHNCADCALQKIAEKSGPKSSGSVK